MSWRSSSERYAPYIDELITDTRQGCVEQALREQRVRLEGPGYGKVNYRKLDGRAFVIYAGPPGWARVAALFTPRSLPPGRPGSLPDRARLQAYEDRWTELGVNWLPEDVAAVFDRLARSPHTPRLGQDLEESLEWPSW